MGFKPWLRAAIWLVGALLVVWVMFGCAGAYRCQA